MLSYENYDPTFLSYTDDFNIKSVFSIKSQNTQKSQTPWIIKSSLGSIVNKKYNIKREDKASIGLFPKLKHPFTTLYNYLQREYRNFYVQVFGVSCKICGYNFFYVYHSLNLTNCPNCGKEFCRYCIEEVDEKHDKNRCLRRYYLIYFCGLISFVILYLKFIFMCNAHLITKYSTATIFLIENIFFYDEVDSYLSNCLIAKNIILAIILLKYCNEEDILFYILVGFVQMICILLINNFSDKCKKKLTKYKS